MGKRGQGGFDRLAAFGQAIQEARAVKILDARPARGIGLRIHIAPVRQLRQRGLHFVERRGRSNAFDTRCVIAVGNARQHFVGPQIRHKLALGRRKGIHDRAIQRRLVGADVAKQLALGEHKSTGGSEIGHAASGGSVRMAIRREGVHVVAR